MRLPIVRDTAILVGGLIAIVFVLGLGVVSASSANISHSYNTTTNITSGSLVSLDAAQPDYVKLANSDNGSQLLGIAVVSSDSLLAVNPSNGKGTVQVATNGSANVLVSTVNGEIKVGDAISVSPFNGVGMRAEAGTKIIGLAETAFNSKSQGTTTKVTDKSGHEHQILIGYLRLSIGVGVSSGTADSQLNEVQRLAKALTGHNVSTLRAVISLIIAVVASAALITLIYASIYGGVISIGRNPLAKFAVFRSLSVVMGMVVLVAAVAALTIFLLLR